MTETYILMEFQMGLEINYFRNLALKLLNFHVKTQRKIKTALRLCVR